MFKYRNFSILHNDLFMKRLPPIREYQWICNIIIKNIISSFSYRKEFQFLAS